RARRSIRGTAETILTTTGGRSWRRPPTGTTAEGRDRRRLERRGGDYPGQPPADHGERGAGNHGQPSMPGRSRQPERRGIYSSGATVDAIRNDAPIMAAKPSAERSKQLQPSTR
ncbi:MAG: hypothetical protein IK077_10920, partial [Thermoguttaceae bacterium]|nr:hypothetical protein [Thermoguttaceae bacterium]